MTSAQLIVDSTEDNADANTVGSATINQARTITELVQDVERSLQLITDALIASPADLFRRHEHELRQLIRVTNRTDTLHAAFAFAASEAQASRKVGSVHTADYLVRALDISRYQAKQWLSLGMKLFAAPPPATIAPPLSDATTDPDRPDALDGHDELAERRKQHELHQKQLRDQAEARRRARDLSNAKLSEINRELEHLDDSLKSQCHEDLLNEATKKAEETSLSDLKLWLRSKVREANRSVGDPFADLRARKVTWSQPDERGNVRLNAVLPRTGHALLEVLLAPARLVAWEKKRGIDVEEDKRSLPQRRADALMAMFEKWAEEGDAAASGRTRGLASLVIAMSAKDLTQLPEGCSDPGDAADSGDSGDSPGGASTRWLPTNTNAKLSPLDVLRLGLAQHDLGVVVEPRTGRALDSAKVKRHASVQQKLMLVAEQLCCAYPGCNQSACESDVHHVLAWARGGRTDIENLTLLCRHHHRMNRDQRDGGLGMGHAEVDPVTGRVGWREARARADADDAEPLALPGVLDVGELGVNSPTRGGTDGSSASDWTDGSSAPGGSRSAGHQSRSQLNRHPRLSDEVAINGSTTAREAPGMRVMGQEWESDEVRLAYEAGEIAGKDRR